MRNSESILWMRKKQKKLIILLFKDSCWFYFIMFLFIAFHSLLKRHIVTLIWHLCPMSVPYTVWVYVLDAFLLSCKSEKCKPTHYS